MNEYISHIFMHIFILLNFFCFARRPGLNRFGVRVGAEFSLCVSGGRVCRMCDKKMRLFGCTLILSSHSQAIDIFVLVWKWISNNNENRIYADTSYFQHTLILFLSFLWICLDLRKPVASLQTKLNVAVLQSIYIFINRLKLKLDQGGLDFKRSKM